MRLRLGRLSFLRLSLRGRGRLRLRLSGLGSLLLCLRRCFLSLSRSRRFLFYSLFTIRDLAGLGGFRGISGGNSAFFLPATSVSSEGCRLGRMVHSRDILHIGGFRLGLRLGLLLLLLSSLLCHVCAFQWGTLSNAKYPMGRQSLEEERRF